MGWKTDVGLVLKMDPMTFYYKSHESPIFGYFDLSVALRPEDIQFSLAIIWWPSASSAPSTFNVVGRTTIERSVR